MKRLVILIHSHGSFDDPRYFLREFAEIWSEQGMRVTVMKGPGNHVDADLAINHVDLTFVPEDHLAYLGSYPATVNARVADISKRHISKHLVRKGDGYDGPIIIKTNRNTGGCMEFQLASAGLAPPVKVLIPDNYPILKSPSPVASHVWDDPDFVVERFLPELRDGFYCLRTWVFLGDKETHSLSYSKVPIVKSSNVVRREALSSEDVPPDLRRIRREMGFDFGKFDYTLVNGTPILFDVNRTPSVGNFSREQYMPRIRHLAQGIHAFL